MNPRAIPLRSDYAGDNEAPDDLVEFIDQRVERGQASSTAAVDDHYEQHPQVRPSLGDLAVAAAELDGHPLAAEPNRLRQAAAEIMERHPDADADDVLLWAEARCLPVA